MGREWHNGGRSICSSKSNRKSNEANGCITALYHFFHFHHSYFPSRHHYNQPSIDSPSRNPKGLVAPRNSLELTEEYPLSTNYNQNKSLNIPVGRKKSKLRDLLVDTSFDIYNSPRTKTPNVVARLMGIDLLPDNLGRLSLCENGSGTRSLPESPRISSARKSTSDIPRLFLQLNRETKYEEFGMDVTSLLENRKVGTAQNQTELRKVRSRFSQQENAVSPNPRSLFRQNQISQEPKLLSSSRIKETLSKDSKENLIRVNEQPLRSINGRKKADSESKLSPHQTPNNQNKQRRASIYKTSTQSKPDRCNPLVKKKCKKIAKSNDISNTSVASSAYSATERPRKQMKRAEEPEQDEDATICSGKMYSYEEKLPQKLRASNLDDSTTIYGIFSTGGSTSKDFYDLPGMKKLEEEKERVVAEIERHIVDALVLETVRATAFEGLNVAFNNAVRFVGP